MLSVEEYRVPDQNLGTQHPPLTDDSARHILGLSQDLCLCLPRRPACIQAPYGTNCDHQHRPIVTVPVQELCCGAVLWPSLPHHAGLRGLLY